MEIRADFKSEEMLLNRLVEYSKAFRINNDTHWSHLKNKEDFRNIYNLEFKVRDPLESIYRDGRDLSVFMSSRLIEFNYSDDFPSLKSFVNSFKGGWVYQIEDLKNESQIAKDICSKLDNIPWAMTEMICLFDRQIELVLSVKQTIEGLKETDIYRWENGEIQASFPIPEYMKILECIHSIGKMFERLPSTYIDKGEEALRDHILVSLEALVLGSATGETFNKRGKTDILVRNGSSNEFIGECKFWHGQSIFLDTITQLLSYLSWRDTNTAVIIFVKNADFTAVLNTVQESVGKHPNFLKEMEHKDETWLNYEFRMNEDKSRVLKLAVMLYHLV